MKIVKKNGLRILTASKNKHIRSIDDVYTPATEEAEEHIPYYATEIYLGINFDESKVDEFYVEEEIEEKEE